jgi:hypothetical protein
MYDFGPVRRKEVTLAEFVADFEVDDLRALTNEMIDEMLSLISDCSDEDVAFEPDDPDAFDSAAKSESEVRMPWTLGHVIAHVTASGEETAFLATELARGVTNHGRSRFETPWGEVTSVAQCRQRLEESRRMRLAMLNAWPDDPHLELLYQPSVRAQPRNALAHFVAGLVHDASHLDQIADVVRQSREARALVESL